MTNNGAVAEKLQVKLVGRREKLATGIPKTGLFLVVGAVKTGKSEFIAQFPNSYVLSCEREGMDHIEGRIHAIANLDEFRQVLMAVVKEPSIKTICIDTIDAVAEWVAKDVANDFGMSHIQERKKGVDGFAVWGEFGNRMKNLTNLLMESNKLIVMSAHYKAGEVDVNGEKVNANKLAISGSAANYLAYHAKLIGNTYKADDGEKTKYLLSFRGGPVAGEWGSRVEEVQDKVIELPKEGGYQAFAELFKTKTKKGGK